MARDRHDVRRADRPRYQPPLHGSEDVGSGANPRASPARRHAITTFPPGWYLFGSLRALRRGPVAREILGKDLVGFLTQSGRPAVLNGRCVHMGSDLGNGCVVGETLQCSLHHWRFGVDGACVQIPVTDALPAFARQQAYPTAERYGQVYFFHGAEAHYPLPFFDDLAPRELVPAEPFVEYLNCPWYMVGANAVDVQHFAIAHDRKIVGTPSVDHPHWSRHRTVCHFEITGRSFFDRLTRRFGGPDARLTISDWASTMIFAHSALARSETFGMLSMTPLNESRTRVDVTVLARRSTGSLRRRLDWCRARVRRALIRSFLRSDVPRLSKTNYSPGTLIDIDRQFAEYFDWLASLNEPRKET